jgi:hypothetical protein
MLQEDVYRSEVGASTCAYTCVWNRAQADQPIILFLHGTCIELAQEVLATKIVRSSVVTGHETRCLFSVFGCLSRPILSPTYGEEPTMGVRPLTLEQQECLLAALRHYNSVVGASVPAIAAGNSI